jgi:hypothetical protein
MQVGARQRLTLRQDAAVMETLLAGGEGLPVRAIPYGSIRALYVYEERDWTYLAVLFGYWMLLALLVVGLALVPGVGWQGALLFLALGSLALAIHGVIRILRRPRRMLRIEQESVSIALEARSPEFIAAFAARIEPPAAPASDPTPAFPPAPEAPPPG